MFLVLIHKCNFFYRYPDYQFISDNEFSKAAGLKTRYSDASLRGIILDVHFLSKSDYLVCTFSSTVSIVTEVQILPKECKTVH